MAERGILEQAYGQLIPQGMQPNYAAPRTSVEPTPMVGRGEIRPYTFSWRDMARQWLGSIGMSDNTANAVITLADFTPVGAAFVGNEARRAVTRGERLAPAAEVAMAAIPLPMAAKRAASKVVREVAQEVPSISTQGIIDGKPAVRVADEGSGIFRVFVGDNNAGTISIAKSGQGDFVSAAYLEPQFTGKRYGMDAYNQIEQQIGRRLVPSPLGLSANARPFWRRRLAEMSEEERQDVFRRSYNAGIGYGVPDRDVRLRLYEVGGGNALDALDGVAPNLGGETPSVTVY